MLRARAFMLRRMTLVYTHTVKLTSVTEGRNTYIPTHKHKPSILPSSSLSVSLSRGMWRHAWAHVDAKVYYRRICIYLYTIYVEDARRFGKYTVKTGSGTRETEIRWDCHMGRTQRYEARVYVREWKTDRGIEGESEWERTGEYSASGRKRMRVWREKSIAVSRWT